MKPRFWAFRGRPGAVVETHPKLSTAARLVPVEPQDTDGSDMPTPTRHALALVLAAAASGALAQGFPTVGGAPMLPSRTILTNAEASTNHSSLLTAVYAAGLEGELSGDGPLTLFAPTDAAFDALPRNTGDALLQPGAQEQLAAVLRCHIVDGEVTREALASEIEAAGGSYEVETAGPCTLTATLQDDRVVLTDGNDRSADISTADTQHANGIMHVTDRVFLPAQ